MTPGLLKAATKIRIRLDSYQKRIVIQRTESRLPLMSFLTVLIKKVLEQKVQSREQQGNSNGEYKLFGVFTACLKISGAAEKGVSVLNHSRYKI